MFVESYGKLAVEGSSFSPGIDAVVDDGTRQLAAAGFSSRSGWLTSSVFGGGSWLAHATLQSGVWVDQPGRYDELIAGNRLTLTKAFRRAGWRTVADMPSNTRPWPEGSSFYRYDKIYDRRNVGYRGPKYAFASMPDQYVLLALQRLELGKPHRHPLFAEVDLVSSHAPWTRVPRLINWGRVGDGSIFKRLPVDEVGLNDSGRDTPSRSGTPFARCSRSSSITAVRTWCSSCSATISPRESRAIPGRATTCRSPSSRTTRR